MLSIIQWIGKHVWMKVDDFIYDWMKDFHSKCFVYPTVTVLKSKVKQSCYLNTLSLSNPQGQSIDKLSKLSQRISIQFI